MAKKKVSKEEIKENVDEKDHQLLYDLFLAWCKVRNIKVGSLYWRCFLGGAKVGADMTIKSVFNGPIPTEEQLRGQQ